MPVLLRLPVLLLHDNTGASATVLSLVEPSRTRSGSMLHLVISVYLVGAASPPRQRFRPYVGWKTALSSCRSCTGLLHYRMYVERQT